MSARPIGFSPKRPQSYSESDIIREIRRVIVDECGGVVPSQTRFLSLARISHWLIRKRYGTYVQAVQKAGFDYDDVRARFTPERVIANLREVLEYADGYRFTYAFYRKNGGDYCSQTIKSILGTNWNETLDMIGAKQKPHVWQTTAHALRRKEFAKLNDSDLLNEIERIWKAIGRRPTYSEFRKASAFGMKVYESHFGSWVNAIESFCDAKGVRVQGRSSTRVTKKVLLNELQSIQSKRQGDLLTYRFYKANGGTYSIGTFQNHFQSWTQAVNAVAGVSGKQAGYSKDELFDEMQRLWECFGRQPSWSEMWQHGVISPKCYKTMFGTWTKAVYAFCEDRNAESSLEAAPEHTDPTRSEIEHVTQESVANCSPSRGPAPLIYLRRTGRAVPKRLRFRVLRRDLFTCQACGRTPKKDDIVLEVDHIIAYTNGGETVFENLQTLCRDCNSGKSDQ